MKKSMRVFGLGALVLAAILFVWAGAATCAHAQSGRAARQDAEFGPIVRAYLGYLRAQQEVVDDRHSRHEINPLYYRHNSNRIKALRQMAVRLARESGNDYLPELEAVSADEFETLFDEPPKPAELRAGGVLNYTFRYLGAVGVAREKFYLFARLDPYEQAELRKAAGSEAPPAGAHASAHPSTAVDATARPRRVNAP